VTRPSSEALWDDAMTPFDSADATPRAVAWQ
jgi:hypothetical protein